MSRLGSVQRVGIVIPTLGSRPNYLDQAVNSIRMASIEIVYIIVVAPHDCKIPSNLEIDEIVVDPGNGLAAAINFGIEQLPESIEFVNWLGDDDLLEAGSLDLSIEALSDRSIPFVFGRCNYINDKGRLLFTNRSGKWAVQLMRFGPQLIPQPGSLMRRSAFVAVGGLDPRYKWAFDLDLFIRLSKLGRPLFLPRTLASFRWHSDSLSVGGRIGSVNEASDVRISHLPSFLQRVSVFWEPLMRRMILIAGQRIKA